MAEYKILFKKSVWKDFKSIPDKDLSRILDLIKGFSKDPRPAGCTKLSGQEKYRVRLGRYRIIYSIQDRELSVWVVKVGHRKDVYR
ncbi:type II toxin-antitoxin system RelE/ParE family toxin [bacterium]|nr:type II toxin-antitoxin system RelE/ParE family toxin [bacterium]